MQVVNGFSGFVPDPNRGALVIPPQYGPSIEGRLRLRDPGGGVA